MAQVIIGVKSDEIRAEEAQEEFAPCRKGAENIAAGERGVEEETDPETGLLLAQHRGEEEEVVVVNPNDVIILGNGDDGVGKFFVGLFVEKF